MFHTKSRVLAVVFLAVFALFLNGCARPSTSSSRPGLEQATTTPGGFSSQGSAIDPKVLAPVTVADTVLPPPPAVLATASQRNPVQVTSEALSGLDQAAFVSARIGTPPTTDYAQGRWFYVTLKNAGDGWNNLYSIWQAQLAQGAISEKFTTGGALDKAVVGSSFLFQEPSGEVKDVVGGGAGAGASFQRFGTARTTENVSAGVSKILAKYGMRLTNLKVLRPLDDAVAISVTTPTEGALKNARNLLADLDPGQYEGFYLQVELPSGDQLVATGSDGRTGAGDLWLKPGTDFGSSIGIVHS